MMPLMIPDLASMASMASMGHSGLMAGSPQDLPGPGLVEPPTKISMFYVKLKIYKYCVSDYYQYVKLKVNIYCVRLKN